MVWIEGIRTPHGSLLKDRCSADLEFLHPEVAISEEIQGRQLSLQGEAETSTYMTAATE